MIINYHQIQEFKLSGKEPKPVRNVRSIARPRSSSYGDSGRGFAYGLHDYEVNSIQDMEILG